MVASTNSNGIGRPLLRTSDTSINDGRTQSSGKYFNTLKAHMQDSANSVKENYECQQCGKQFGNQQILQLHKRIHESQSLLRDVPGAAATLVSTTHLNGVLSINFNVTLDIPTNDHEGMTLKERLNKLLKSDSLWENVSQSLGDMKCLTESETVNKLLTEETPVIQEADQQTERSDEFRAVTENTSCRPEEVSSSGPEEVSQNNTVSHEDSSAQPEKEAEPGTTSFNQPISSPVRTQHISRGRKTVGLTKIRMEDCRRCDACSCIYMDERDYIKHMKNFHKHDISSIPLEGKEALNFRPFRHKQHPKRLGQSPSPPQKKSCRSCCKQCKCRGNHDTLQPLLPILRPVLGRQTNRTPPATHAVLPFDIKDRWNKVVTQRLTENVPAAPEASDSDISDLLSQVEVKIKTEPTDVVTTSTCGEETHPLVAIKEERLDVEMLEF